MSTRSGRLRQSVIEPNPVRTRKGISPTRSPARTTKSSPSTRYSTRKSPSRKSPARKSPSRKSISKNPPPKSPSKPVKEAVSIKLSSPSKRPAIKSDVEVKDIPANIDFYRSTRSRRIEYSIQDLQTGISKTELSIDDNINGFESHLTTVNDYGLRNRKPVEEVPLRRSSRLQEFFENNPDVRRSISKSINDSKSVSKSISKSIEAFSDEDNSEDELLRRKSMSVTRRLTTPLRTSVAKLIPLNNKFEFGGKLGPFLLIILIPTTVFSILMSCTKLCSHKQLLDLSDYKSIDIWFSQDSLILVVIQYLIQIIFVILPICGRKEQGNEKGKIQYFNAFFSSIFTITILFIIHYVKHINVDVILGLYLSLAAISYIIGVLMAIFLYIKSHKLDSRALNPYGNTGYLLNDFFVGREIHSSIKKLNIKLWISRTSNINTLILSILIFKHSFELPTIDIQTLSLDNYRDVISKVHFKPTTFLYSMIQIIYILNFIMKEHKIISTFYWHSEGLGYLQIVSSALYPYYFTSISKYVVDVDLNMSTNALVATLTLSLVGFLIMLISNNIKHEFRKNPFQLSIMHMDSMPTLHGNKLLVSNVWGILRHPNYTGDILIHIALALPGVITNRIMAALPAILTIAVLLHRAWRDHGRCSQRYGAAWQRYCKRVPSVFIPKIV